MDEPQIEFYYDAPRIDVLLQVGDGSILDRLKNSPLETTILLMGGTETGKVGRLLYDSSQENQIRAEYHPPDAGWDELKRIDLYLNDHALDNLMWSERGAVHATAGEEIIVKDWILS